MRTEPIATGSDRFVSCLHLRPTGRGQGLVSMLPEAVKTTSLDELKLPTCVANSGAQRFHPWHSFQDVRRTDSENEKKLPDSLLSRQPEGALS